MKILALACAVLALSATAALADPAPAPAAGEAARTQQASTLDRDRVICRTDTLTGSRLRKTRVCRTMAEWDQIREDARKGINDLERDRNIALNPMPSAGGG